jgi:hypothetical protein
MLKLPLLQYPGHCDQTNGPLKQPAGEVTDANLPLLVALNHASAEAVPETIFAKGYVETFKHIQHIQHISGHVW